MKLTKEDLMKLSKERLVELLLETQCETDGVQPWRYVPYPVTDNPPCWAPGGFCSNPQRDCINCPRFSGGGYGLDGGTWSTTTTINTGTSSGAVPEDEKKPLND